MALILNIDTATEYASIAFSKEGNTITITRNREIRDHASWLHQAILSLMEENRFTLSQLQAIAVTAGPGSYTGLRVGMATAKGLCYVLKIPLIVENTLKVMAYAASKELQLSQPRTSNLEYLLVPMIDARRMEVFTAVYDGELEEIMPPAAMVLNDASFAGINAGKQLVCFGNGSGKFQSIASPEKFRFVSLEHDAGALGSLSYQKYLNREFADLAYAEPLYLKEFYSPPKK
jgi:tRNA threonylcarbamoyladenosine biosynthesis protein TsaB